MQATLTGGQQGRRLAILPRTLVAHFLVESDGSPVTLLHIEIDFVVAPLDPTMFFDGPDQILRQPPPPIGTTHGEIAHDGRGHGLINTGITAIAQAIDFDAGTGHHFALRIANHEKVRSVPPPPGIPVAPVKFCLLTLAQLGGLSFR